MNKVLYVHRTQGVGVEGVHIAGIAGGFESQGYTIDYLSPVRKNQTDDLESHPRAPSKAHSWVSSHLPEFLFEVMEILYNLTAIFEGIRKPSAKKYHFIYERYAIFSLVGYVISRYSGCPLVLEINYTSRSPLVRKRSRFLKPLAHWMDQWLFKRADLLLPVSGELQRQLIAQFGVDRSKIVVVSNGCDKHASDIQSAGRSGSDVFSLGFVGGFYPWHGLEILIAGVKILHDKGYKIRCILIGDGPELQRIVGEVNRLALSNTVQFAGRVSHGKLAGYFNEIDVGVLPDTNNYGSPMKLFEYMNSGIPFVAADYGPVEEITSGQGLLFLKKSPEDLAASVESLIIDPQLYRQMAERAKLLAKTEYSWISLSQRVTTFLSQKGSIS